MSKKMHSLMYMHSLELRHIEVVDENLNILLLLHKYYL